MKRPIQNLFASFCSTFSLTGNFANVLHHELLGLFCSLKQVRSLFQGPVCANSSSLGTAFSPFSLGLIMKIDKLARVFMIHYITTTNTTATNLERTITIQTETKDIIRIKDSTNTRVSVPYLRLPRHLTSIFRVPA